MIGTANKLTEISAESNSALLAIIRNILIIFGACIAIAFVLYACISDLDNNYGYIIAGLISSIIVYLMGQFTYPALANKILVRKQKQYLAWWDESLENFKKISKGNAQEDSIKNNKAVSIWYDDALRRLADKSLIREKAMAFKNAGGAISPDYDFSELETENEFITKYCTEIDPKKIRLISLVAACGCGFCSGSVYTFGAVNGAVLGALQFLAISLLAVSALCDEQAHVLPFELSFALYPIALAIGFVSGGPEGLLIAIACIFVTLAIFYLIRIILKFFFGRASAIGAGDTRTAPAIAGCCGLPGLIYGCIACCVTQLAVSGLSIAKKESALSTKSPMGIYLLIWLSVGMLVLNIYSGIY